MKAADKRKAREMAKNINHWIACERDSAVLAKAKHDLGITYTLAEVITSNWADPNEETLALLEEGYEPIRKIFAREIPVLS